MAVRLTSIPLDPLTGGGPEAASQHLIDQGGRTSRTGLTASTSSGAPTIPPVVSPTISTAAAPLAATGSGSSNTAKTAGAAAAATTTKTSTTQTSASAAPTTALTAKYIVFLDSINGSDRANLPARMDAILRSLGNNLKPGEVFDYLNGFTLTLTDQQAQRLRALGGVKSVEADAVVQLVAPVATPPTTADPLTGISALPTYSDTTVPGGSSEQIPWGVNAVWSGQSGYLASPGVGKYAFVIDTGISSSTGDLNVDTANGYNWISGTTQAEDDNGHGTHVSGTIAALSNGIGVVGVAAGATVVPLKVLNASGTGTLGDIISAINFTLNKIATLKLAMSDVVANISITANTTLTSLDTAVFNAANQGLRFAIAAGNNGTDVDSFTPARTGDHANVYTVSAVDNTYKMANWSNWDRLDKRDKVDDIDFATPGVNVLSLGRTAGSLATMSGTSMASPHMAGLLLTGGVVSGGLVTPFYSGTADPFALHA